MNLAKLRAGVGYSSTLANGFCGILYLLTMKEIKVGNERLACNQPMMYLRANTFCLI